MNRRYWAVGCFAVSLAVHVQLVMQGHIDPDFLFPLAVCWGAFVEPVLPLVWIERVCGFAPFADGHRAITVALLMLAASVFWFFALPRCQRWFGIFDAFKEGLRRRLLLVRGAAYALDAVNKRLFGRQKTGGWA